MEAEPSSPLITTALVLAAGTSTRIRAAAGDRPKPLIAVRGRTVLERNLDLLTSAGVTDVWINLHYRPDDIRRAIGDGSAFGLNVRYSFEPELLGTAGAAAHLAAQLRPGPFFVVYGDNLLSLDLARMARQHRASHAPATIALFHQERVPNSGMAGGRVSTDAHGFVTDFVEGGGTSPYVNGGVYILEATALDAIPAHRPVDFGRDVFPAMLAANQQLGSYQIDGYCLAIDTPEALHRAELLLAALEHPSELVAQ